MRKFKIVDTFSKGYLNCLTSPATAIAIGRPAYAKYSKFYRIFLDNVKTLSNSEIDFLYLNLDKEFLGTVKVTHSLSKGKVVMCEVGIMLAPHLRGMDVGSTIIEKICTMIFILNKDIIITGGTAASNLPMIRVFEKNSFQRTAGFLKFIQENDSTPTEIVRFTLSSRDKPSLQNAKVNDPFVLVNLSRFLNSLC
jgi:hypothetical protein